ncbi:MAG TPA: transcriptional repressor [Terriglobales bacterium]|nr:transcriptional repressor [Terriglobales bacterium]
MERDPRDLRSMTDRFEREIRRAGVKRTPQRMAIFREVARTGDHPDIETVYKNVRRKMPTVSLDTVYRALALFRDLGLVMTVRPLDDRARFDANMAPHHHFVCTRCGALRDLTDPRLDGLEMPRGAAALGRVDSRHVEFRGVCADCLKKSRGLRPAA